MPLSEALYKRLMSKHLSSWKCCNPDKSELEVSKPKVFLQKRVSPSKHSSNPPLIGKFHRLYLYVEQGQDRALKRSSSPKKDQNTLVDQPQLNAVKRPTISTKIPQTARIKNIILTKYNANEKSAAQAEGQNIDENMDGKK